MTRCVAFGTLKPFVEMFWVATLTLSRALVPSVAGQSRKSFCLFGTPIGNYI